MGIRLEPTGGNQPARVVRATVSCRTIIRKMSQRSRLHGVMTDLPGKLWLDDARESARAPGLVRMHSTMRREARTSAIDRCTSLWYSLPS